MKKITKHDIAVIFFVAFCISSAIYFVWKDFNKPQDEYCWYQIEYLHMSGKVETTKEYCTCQGFYPWYDGNKYKIEMTIPFAHGHAEQIQGATDTVRAKTIP